jgi:oligopeptidase A
MDNPLLNHQQLPQFSHIRPEHIISAIDTIINDNRVTIDKLIAEVTQPTWHNFIAPIEILENRLNRTWSPINHLNAVMNSSELREAYTECLPKLSLYFTELGQNIKLYQAYKTIAVNSECENLDVAQRKLLDNALRGFRLSGVDLPPEQKTRFKEINQQLSQLSSKFSDNVLDATKAWTKLITNPAELAGLPQSALDLLQQNARHRNQEGWLLTLDFPSYSPIITYATNRQLRQELYTAYVTRASDQGPHAGQWDNSQLIDKILALRHEQSQLLGFATFADRALIDRMARTPQIVLNFLRDLARRAYPQAVREFAELTEFARTTDSLKTLAAWDVAYYSEKLRQARYAISQEELRPYFPVPKVIAGLFAIAERLFNIRIQETSELNTWHPDVTCYAIRTIDDNLIGIFYLDPYARVNKRGGAWMDGCVDRMLNDGKIQIPAAYLICNFSPPLNNKPSLLTHEEVTTLFHEFGHGVHHLLTKIDYPAVAGTNGVAWDAVELPSQFLENWCWERESLNLFAVHWENHDPLPQALYDKMHRAKNFQSAMQFVRQLEFALFDFQLHYEYDPTQGARVLEKLNSIRKEVAVIIPPSFNRMPHSFNHIFSGGYAAGYYSYKWAEVLSADAFSVFEERGLFDTASGQAFKEQILEQGGAKDANELFVAFRGREPSIEPLLRHCGIANI